MAFIPKDSLEVGDIVYLTENVEVLAGTYEKGTKMTITGNTGMRGWDLVDDFGNNLVECPSFYFSKASPEQ